MIIDNTSLQIRREQQCGKNKIMMMSGFKSACKESCAR